MHRDKARLLYDGRLSRPYKKVQHSSCQWFRIASELVQGVGFRHGLQKSLTLYLRPAQDLGWYPFPCSRGVGGENVMVAIANGLD